MLWFPIIFHKDSWSVPIQASLSYMIYIVTTGQQFSTMLD